MRELQLKVFQGVAYACYGTLRRFSSLERNLPVLVDMSRDNIAEV